MPIWNEDARDQVTIGLSSSRSWIGGENGAGFDDWTITERNEGKAQLHSASSRVNPILPPPEKNPYLKSQDKRYIGKMWSRVVFANEDVLQCVRGPLPPSFLSTLVCANHLWVEEKFLYDGIKPWVFPSFFVPHWEKKELLCLPTFRHCFLVSLTLWIGKSQLQYSAAWSFLQQVKWGSLVPR